MPDASALMAGTLWGWLRISPSSWPLHVAGWALCIMMVSGWLDFLRRVRSSRASVPREQGRNHKASHHPVWEVTLCHFLLHFIGFTGPDQPDSKGEWIRRAYGYFQAWLIAGHLCRPAITGRKTKIGAVQKRLIPSYTHCGGKMANGGH